MKSIGIKTIRFKNNEIINNIDEVILRIKKVISSKG